MLKAYKYRIYPTKKQQRIMEQTLDICRELYNAALQERRDAYKLKGITLNYHSQAIQLPDIKETRSDLKAVHSQVLQEVLRRLDKAFDNFFRRLKAGQQAGYPRFQGRNRYNSFTYPQQGFNLINSKLRLSKIGDVKIKLHRKMMGQVKTLTITRNATGKWFACFSIDTTTEPLLAGNKPVGADAGLKDLLTLSDGTKIEPPKFLRKEEKALTKAQRKLAKLPKGSKQRKRQRRVVAKVHERITNKRADFAHKLSRWLVITYGIIIFENLRIANMVKNHSLAKSITDAAWSQIINFTTYKAAYAGGQVIQVEPRYTSQDCHKCGHRKSDLSLSDRVYHCANPSCNISIDRDLNAALNILALGLQGIGVKPIEAHAL